MNDEPDRPPKSGPTFAGQIGAKAARKLKARRNSAQGVWFGLGMMGLDRLVGGGSDAARRGARHLAGQAPSGQAFLDAGAAGRRARDRLFECVALGRQGRQGHAGGTGG